MHTNFYFLRQLAPVLEMDLIRNYTQLDEPQSALRLMACFSQDRDEVVLVFAQAKGKINYYKPFYIKATLRPDFSGLIFPETVKRARHNSIDLFESVIGGVGIGRAVLGVRSFLNERCLAILLEDDFTILFKFFGNRPNLLAFRNNEVIDQFNRQLITDQNLKLDSFDRPIDQSYDAFVQAGFDHRKLFPTFGRIVNNWLTERGVGNKQNSGEEQWAIIQNVVQQLENPTYYVTVVDYKPTLSLLSVGDIKQTFTDPFEAANHFYSAYNRLTTLDQEKGQLLRLLEKRRKRAEARIEANMQRLMQRESGVSHEEMGHILMANLHEVPLTPGALSPERLVLYDFYRDVPVTLKLKPDLSPQKNAENFYRKAKNEKIEEQYLIEQVTSREAELVKIDKLKVDLEAVTALKELRRYVKQHQLLNDDGAGRTDESTPLFKEVVLDTFHILIGRTAKNNDLLTQKYAYKEDLWLHARDVAGSHVVVKYQAGKPFPKNVIERAAELAAWYSKRRTDSLCPVTVTPKKFVRKPKGLAEGKVLVDKEDVVLVVPKGE